MRKRNERESTLTGGGRKEMQNMRRRDRKYVTYIERMRRDKRRNDIRRIPERRRKRKGSNETNRQNKRREVIGEERKENGRELKSKETYK